MSADSGRLCNSPYTHQSLEVAQRFQIMRDRGQSRANVRTDHPE